MDTGIANNTQSAQVLNVPIEDIIPNRFQPRINFDENGLKELADSIKEHGIIQPLVLRRLQDKYEIIAGERRYKAAKLAGLSYVPAIISEMDDKKSAEVAIVENVQRRDLSSIEEAKSYQALLDKGYLTQEELAKKMGLSQSAISNKLRLLSLSEEVQNALMEGKISERHARSLLAVDDKNEQNKWLNTIIDERLTVRELDQRLKKANNSGDEVPIIDIAPNINEIKQNATDIAKPISTPKPQVEEPENNNGDFIMPNKFFNFLEDESANMNTRTTIEPEVNTEPVEEVELLDIDMSPLPESNSTEPKDMSIATSLINQLEVNLKNNDYKVNLVKDENDKELKFTITIEKE